MFLRVLVFYLITLVFSGGMNALQSATGPPDLIQLVQFAPALAVGVMFLLFRRTIRVQARFTPAAEVAGRSATIVGIVVAATLATAGVHVLAGHDLHGWWSDGLPFPFWALVLTMVVGAAGEELGWRAYLQPYLQTRFSVLRSSVSDGLPFPFWALVLTMVVGAAGEELGWRAYLQPYLQTRFSVLRSSVIVGLLWGFWHIGGFEHGLVYMGLFVVMATALSVVMGAVLRVARGANLAVATAAHAAVNLGMLLLFDEENGDKFPMAALAAVWVVAAIVTHLVHRRVPAEPQIPALV